MTATVLVAMLATGALYLWYGHRARRLADERLAWMIGVATVADAAETTEAPKRRIRTFPPRYRYAPAAAGAIAGSALWLLVRLPVEIGAAAGLLVGVIAYLIEDYRGEQQAALIESQLAA